MQTSIVEKLHGGDREFISIDRDVGHLWCQPNGVEGNNAREYDTEDHSPSPLGLWFLKSRQAVPHRLDNAVQMTRYPESADDGKY